MFRLKSVRLTEHSNLAVKGNSERSKHAKKTDARLAELNDLLRESDAHSRLVLIKWSSRFNALIVAFSGGLIAWLFLDVNTYKVDFVYFDKHLVGKLASHHVVDFIWKDDDAIFISYTEPKVTGIFLPPASHHQQGSRTLSHQGKSFKLKNAHGLKLLELDLTVSNTTRRVPRQLVLHEDPNSLPLLAIWWQMSPNNISPWSAPIRTNKDLANILVYNYADGRFDYISYGSVTSEIVKIVFSRSQSNQIIVVSTGDADASLVFTIFQITADDENLSVAFSLKIPLFAPCLQVAFTSAQDKLMILCEEKTVMMFCLNDNAVYSLRTSIDCISIMCSKFDAFFVVSDRFGQVLMYDYSLGVIPANYDDLSFSSHLDLVDTVKDIKFIAEDFISLCYSTEDQEGTAVTLIVVPHHIDAINIINEYLKHDYISEAISNLLTLNWNFDAYLAYSSLNLIFNFLLKFPLNPLRETQIETTLGAFFRPAHPIDPSVDEEYKLGMYFLAKRFFYHLMRYNSLEKAFLLALDLKCRQLFLLLHKLAIEKGDHKLMEVAFKKANSCRPRHREHTTHKKPKQVRLVDRHEQCSSSHAVYTATESFQSLPHNSASTSGARSNYAEHSICSGSRPPVPAPRKSISSTNSSPVTLSVENLKPPPVQRSAKPAKARVQVVGNGVSATSLMPIQQSPSINSPLGNMPPVTFPTLPIISPTCVVSNNHCYYNTKLPEPLPLPPALPPKKSVTANGEGSPPPPLPSKTFLYNINTSGSNLSLVATDATKPMHEQLDRNTDDSFQISEENTHQLLDRKVSLSSSASISSTSYGSEISTTSSISSHNSSDHVPCAGNRPEKPKIECIHFGIV